MHPSTTKVVVVVLTLSPGFLHAEPEEASEAYEITAAAMVPLLPSQLGVFITTHLDAVCVTATVGLEDTSSGAFPGDVGWHYIMLDAATRETDAASMRAAAQAFPHKRSVARSLFKLNDVRGGGSLPWVIAGRYRLLSKAFRNGHREDIIREVGILLHFATDATLPFNTTRNRDGVATGHLRWSLEDGASRVSEMNRSVRHRLQVTLIHRLRDRLTYEVRVVPERYRTITAPLDAVFEVLLESHRALEELLATDANAMTSLGVVDEKTFVAEWGEYCERVTDPAAEVIESRLEAAALFSAGLIGGAWIEAGSPAPNGWSATTAVEDLTGSKPDETTENQADTVPFVGSRHSTVFHRADCPHAKRIKQTNRVYFKTAEEAQKAGRSPCRSCAPLGP